MPFFHDQSRADLRRMYVDAWRRHRDARPLGPLEDQLVGVIAAHPEYHPTVEADETAIDRDYLPEGGQTNPFLHMGLHLAIREQVSTDRPRGIAALHDELSRKFGSVHEAEHRMIECLGEALWQSQRSGLPPDESAYLETLHRLLGRR
jgi:hypothetical protein